MSEWREFHRPAYRDWRWLETSWFGFFVPDAGLRGHLRAAFRLNQGTAFSMANIYSRGGGVLDMDFFDSQMHVPIGPTDRHCDFRLASGLEVRGRRAPMEYRVDFTSRCGRVVAGLEYEALMEPADLKVTTLDAEAGFAAFHRQQKMSSPPTGHIDQTFRVRGSVCIDGDRYDVNCVSNRDQSWSPRSEFKSLCGTFDNIHFGEDLTVCVQAVESPVGAPRITHGYVLRGSEVRRLKSADVQYRRRGLTPTAMKHVLTDETGETYEIESTVPYAICQDQGSNGLTVMGYALPEWGDQKGYGETMWHWDIPEMQRLIRQARKADPATSIDEVFERLSARGGPGPVKGGT